MLGALAASAAAAALRPFSALAQDGPITKPIPSSGERLPVVGLGTWITFNVGEDAELRDECVAVMRAFFAAGGGLIDSSPMYGSSQPVIGYGLRKLGTPSRLFSADKVWISSGSRGADQIEQSRKYWGVRDGVTTRSRGSWRATQWILSSSLTTSWTERLRSASCQWPRTAASPSSPTGRSSRVL